MKNNRPQPFLIKNLKWVSSVLAVASVLFVYLIPRTMQYSDYSIIRWIPPIFIFLIIPLFELVSLTLFTQRFKLSIGVTAVSILIIGPTFGLFQDYRERIELKKYGVWVKSVVVDKKHSVHKGYASNIWVIKCKYEVNGHIYETLYHDDLKNIHPTGDTIRLVYSSQFPKIYMLEYEWNK